MLLTRLRVVTVRQLPPLATTTEIARFHWQRMYSLPRHVAFHAQVPGYFEKDDHDCWRDDCWPTMKNDLMAPFTFAEGLGVFREQVPMGERTFRTFRWGKGVQIWLTEGRDFRSPNTMRDGPDKMIWGKEQNTDVHRFYKDLIQLRASKPALRRGTRQNITAEKHILAYRRAEESKSLFTVLNLSEQEMTVDLEITGSTICFATNSECRIQIEGGPKRVVLPGLSGAVIE